MPKKVTINSLEDFQAEAIRSMTIIRRELKNIRVSLAAEKKPAYTNLELQEMFSVSSTTLKKWRNNGLLAFSLVGSVYLYSKKDVEKSLKGHTTETTRTTRLTRELFTHSKNNKSLNS